MFPSFYIYIYIPKVGNFFQEESFISLDHSEMLSIRLNIKPKLDYYTLLFLSFFLSFQIEAQLIILQLNFDLRQNFQKIRGIKQFFYEYL